VDALVTFAIAPALLIWGLQASGHAQTQAAGPTSAEPSNSPEALKGLTANTNGKVAGALLRPNAGAIAAGLIPTDPPELSVRVVATGGAAAEPVGRVDLHLLDRQITARLESLEHCRVDVARRRRVPPARILPGTVTLHWTILGRGQVSAVDVLGSTPVDPALLDCIKRDATGWRFAAPVGGTLRPQRAFVFRLLTPASARR